MSEFRDYLIQKAPSVGSVIKKVLEINSELQVDEIIILIRQSTRTQKDFLNHSSDFSAVEVIDEAKVLQLARATLKKI